MYVKSIIRLLAKSGGLSIYAIARMFRVGDSSVYYPLRRLKDAGVVTGSNELTDLGWRLFGLIKATERVWVPREDCARRFGSDALEVGKELRIMYERENMVIRKEIKDPSSEEIFVVERESNASQLAVRASVRTFTIVKRTAWNWPLITAIIQHRRAIFNERLRLLHPPSKHTLL